MLPSGLAACVQGATGEVLVDATLRPRLGVTSVALLNSPSGDRVAVL
jgi:hypothetical protein